MHMIFHVCNPYTLDGYNKYIELIGGLGARVPVRRRNNLDDDSLLLHFLSDVEEEKEEGNDCFFKIIVDIITAHNEMVELPHKMTWQPFHRLLPDEQAKAYPQEITTTNCIIPQFTKVHGVNDLLQLLRSRHKGTLYSQPFSPSPTATTSPQKITMSITAASSSLFHLQQLQEDFVTSFLVGKPLILDVSGLRTPFRFKVTRNIGHPANAISADELTTMQDTLPAQLKVDLDKTFRKRLEFEFHTAGYHVMLETTTGLRTAADHLVKSSMGGDAVNEQQALSDYLLTLYDGFKTIQEVLSEIGIRKLSASQLTCISELPLSNLYSCLKMFAAWMTDGMYDFSTLPYALKGHMSPQDLCIIKAIAQNWDASLSELMDEVHSTNELLSHIESHITSDTGQTPITSYLRGLSLISDEDRLPQHIPNTVLIQHYVEFRVVLRRIMCEVQHKMETEGKDAADAKPQQWKEVVEDIWSEYLPHFRKSVTDHVYMSEGDYMYLFDPATGRYGFQYDIGSEGEDDLMAGVEEEEKEERESKGDGEGSVVAEDEQNKPVVQSAVSEKVLRMMKNPAMEKKLVSIMKTLEEESMSVSERAIEYTPKKVAEFLKTNGLGLYAEDFIENEMSGDLLLDADDEVLQENGVHSHLHRVKILVLFKRHVLGTTASQSVDDVIDFLNSQKLKDHVETFRVNSIDGDILTAILAREDKVREGEKVTVADLILQEDLGMKSPTQRLKVKKKFKGFCDALTSTV